MTNTRCAVVLSNFLKTGRLINHSIGNVCVCACVCVRIENGCKRLHSGSAGGYSTMGVATLSGWDRVQGGTSPAV